MAIIFLAIGVLILNLFYLVYNLYSDYLSDFSTFLTNDDSIII